MPKLVVASVQQQMRLFEALEDYRKELNRFLYLARAKGAKLVVFPALTGVMALSPAVEGFRMNLLRRADERYRRQKSLWTRTRSALAGSTAGLLKVSFRKALAAMVADDPAALGQGYEHIFSELAQAYGITILAGSTYMAAGSGAVRNRATVYGPDGAVLGHHDKLMLGAEDEGLATPGDGWTAVDTPIGRLGILFGEEVVYPEAGRVLAYGGADLLVVLCATASETMAAYVRQAALARAQDNQCFALTSFLVGKNYLATDQRDAADLVGKSGIYAPLELTPRLGGVIVEMGTGTSEGLLTAELDGDGLHDLWHSGSQRLRARMPVAAFGDALAALYGGRHTLADASVQAGLAPAALVAPSLAAPHVTAGNALVLPAPPTTAAHDEPEAEPADTDDADPAEADEFAEQADGAIDQDHEPGQDDEPGGELPDEPGDEDHA